jgi:hypothetical protein
MKLRFEPDYNLFDPSDTATWRGHVLDDEGFVVCEVWNNGDGGGNWYVWHDAELRWGIEEDAIKAYAGEDQDKMTIYKETNDLAPMDAWIEDLRNAQE